MALDKRVMVRLSDEVYEELVKVAIRNRRKPSTLARFMIESALGFGDSSFVQYIPVQETELIKEPQ